jgi:hypothetical protein
MSQTTYHDVVDQGVQAVAFLADSEVTVSRYFVLFRRYRVSPALSYWWREARRSSLGCFLLFTDSDECRLFQKDSQKYGIDADQCLVAPRDLHAHFASDYRARIIENASTSADTLSTLISYNAVPESI